MSPDRLRQIDENSNYWEISERARNFDCGFGTDDDDSFFLNSDEDEVNNSINRPRICRVFVDGNESDYRACEDEDCLLERVWSLSKPPKIPKRTFVVSARKIQIMKERLSSTINAKPTLCDILREKATKHGTKRTLVDSDVEYVPVSTFSKKTKASCQENSINIIPQCAQFVNEIC